MDPITLSLIAMGVGTGLSIYGQWKADAKQAELERKNADYYKEQAEFSRKAQIEQEMLFEDQADDFLAKQQTSYAGAGVTMQGSPLLAYADSLKQISAEKRGIKINAQAQQREALLRAEGSTATAGYLESAENKYLPAAGTLLTNASGALARSR